MGQAQPLETIWEIPDGLWEKIQPVLLAADPPKHTGGERVAQRRILNAIIFKLRSGCPWNRLPQELGDDSTIHRVFQQWLRLEVFEQLWPILVENCDELVGVAWKWPAASGNSHGPPDIAMAQPARAASLGDGEKKTGGGNRPRAR